MKIHQISSTTFLRPGAWVATVMSVATIGRLESMSEKIIKMDGFVEYYNCIIIKHSFSIKIMHNSYC